MQIDDTRAMYTDYQIKLLSVDDDSVRIDVATWHTDDFDNVDEWIIDWDRDTVYNVTITKDAKMQLDMAEDFYGFTFHNALEVKKYGDLLVDIMDLGMEQFTLHKLKTP